LSLTQILDKRERFEIASKVYYLRIVQQRLYHVYGKIKAVSDETSLHEGTVFGFDWLGIYA